jgi:hypothetical protein
MLRAKRVSSNVRPVSFREEPSKGTGENAAGYGVKHLRMECRDNVGNGLRCSRGSQQPAKTGMRSLPARVPEDEGRAHESV